MPYQNIDASVSAADVKAIKDAFAVVLEKLPFLVTLTAEERKSTFKTGPDRLSFVTTCATAAEANPTIFPASFDTAAFQKDVALFAVLTELGALVDSIASQIDDTRVAVGGEAMQQSSLVYKYVQTAAKTMPGLKPLTEQLGQQFQKAGKAKEPPAKPNP